MDNRKRIAKKTFIAFIYIALWIALGAGVYFLVKPKPQPIVMPPQINPIQIVWAQSFNIAPNLYSAGAKILNPNNNFGASALKYTFSLYDASGNILTTRSGSSFIWPGETKYLIEGGFNLSAAPVRVDMSFENPLWLEVKNFQGIGLSAQNVKYKKLGPKEGGFFQIDATVFNNTAFNFKEVIVNAVAFGQSKSPITVNKTVVDDLKSGESRAVPFVWFTPFSGVVQDIDVNATTDLWLVPGSLGQ